MIKWHDIPELPVFNSKVIIKVELPSIAEKEYEYMSARYRKVINGDDEYHFILENTDRSPIDRIISWCYFPGEELFNE